MWRTVLIAATLASAAFIISTVTVPPASAQWPPACLDNAGRLLVPAGTTYTDSRGTWICAPGSSAASAGGWMPMRPAPQMPAVTVTPVRNANGGTSSNTGTHVHGNNMNPGSNPNTGGVTNANPDTNFNASTSISTHHAGPRLTAPLSWLPWPAWLALALMFAAGTAAYAALRAWRRRRAPMLAGRVRVADAAPLDLARFGGRATAGTQGDLRLAGEGILPHHATLWAADDGAVWLAPVGQAEVWLERKTLRELLRRPRRLADGDVIVIGGCRTTYDNLAAARRDVKARPAWAR